MVIPRATLLRWPLTWFVVVVLLFGHLPTASAWWQTGHHVIAVLAFELMEEDKQQQLIRILRSHPRFETDFAPPDSIASDPAAVVLWQVGAAGYWPDVARDLPDYNRPKWHYQLGSTMVIGDPNAVLIPETPGPLPTDAGLETRDLHIAQAIELCSAVLADSSRRDADRALAICWLMHLIADGHQPCHAGSLYAENVFPDGDRGANRIELVGMNNLHALWDSLLGSDPAPNQIRRRVAGIQQNRALMRSSAQTANEHSDTLQWLAESRELAVQHVYSAEIRRNVEAATRGLTDEVVATRLDEAYLTTAGRVAEEQAAVAAHRLQAVLSKALQ